MFKDTWASTAGCESVPALEHVCRPKTVFCFARIIQAAGVTFSKDKKPGKRSKSGRSRRLSTGFGPACPGRILTRSTGGQKSQNVIVPGNRLSHFLFTRENVTTGPCSLLGRLIE